MNKVGCILFLLLLTFGYHSFARENVEARTYPLIVNAVQDDGLALMLSDGSEWEIQYIGSFWKLLGWTEQTEISHWSLGDAIEMYYPGSGNFTDFVIVIYNLSNQEKALAKLKQSPSVAYPSCLWITDFDREKKLLTLNDGTRWLKTNTDMYGDFFTHNPTRGDWEIGDPLSLLKGEGWLNANSYFLWNLRWTPKSRPIMA